MADGYHSNFRYKDIPLPRISRKAAKCSAIAGSRAPDLIHTPAGCLAGLRA
jgi:hypothetical protein